MGGTWCAKIRRKAMSDSGIGESFNPFHGTQLEDPYPIFARARREEPIFYSTLLGMWYTAR